MLCQKKKKAIIIVVIVAVAAVIAAVLLKDRIFGSKSAGDAAYVESVSDLMGGDNSGVLNRYSGVVESQETWDVNLSSEQTVKEIFVEEGSEVEEGTPLFEYDTNDLNLQLSQAKLELEEIENEISNYNSQIKTLTAEKASASKDEQFNYTVQIQSIQTSIKQAEYNQESKKIEIQKIQDSMDQSVVTSKITGVVKSINETESTDEYGNAQPFMSILTTGDYRVKGLVSETNVWMLSEGEPVILRSRVNEDDIWTGTIESIDTENQESSNNNNYYSESSSDTQASKYPFYVALDSSEGLMLGQHLYIELDEGQTETKEGIWLYSGYIVEDEETPYIWADNGHGKLEKRSVELGEYDEDLDMYQILSGITEDDYIAWPQDDLYEGMATTTNMEDSILMNDTEDGQ
jgi:HlyD family secretion protein